MGGRTLFRRWSLAAATFLIATLASAGGPARADNGVPNAPDVLSSGNVVFSPTPGQQGDLWVFAQRGILKDVTPKEDHSAGIRDSLPSWSPDGHHIVFQRYGASPNTDLYVVDRDGGHLHRLGASSLAQTSPSWSPDGSRIAFTLQTDN